MSASPIIDPEFHSIIPPLAPEEYELLKENIKRDGCRNALSVWKDQNILLDGHNRLDICNKLNTEYRIEYILIPSRAEAVEWIVKNQLGRRNVPPYVRFELIKHLRPVIEARANERQGARTDLLEGNIVPNLAQGKARDELAKLANVSHGQFDRMAFIDEKAAPEIKEALRKNEITVNAAYTTTKGQLQKQDRLQAVAIVPDGKYSVIVIDPPWPVEKIVSEARPEQIGFDYPTMTLEEIGLFPIIDNVADDCHMFMWTTVKHLPNAFNILAQWGFKYVFTMVWHKPGGFQPFNLPQYNCEFVVYGRKGSPEFVDLKAFPLCFNAPLREHSRKPDEFYDVVKRVCAGKMIDVFSREKREGFDQYGNECEKF